MTDYPRRLHHGTPTWVCGGELFHIRIRVHREQKTALSEPTLSGDLIAAAKRYHEIGQWACELFLLMPDHLHALIRFPHDHEIAGVVRNWKRGTARFQKIMWQENFFDHRIRNEKEAEEKWRYIRRNPTVKGLCTNDDDWPHTWRPEGGAR